MGRFRAFSISSVLFFLFGFCIVQMACADTYSLPPGFGITWNYDSNPPASYTNILILDKSEVQIGTIAADGTVTVSDDAQLDESGTGVAFIINYQTNVSGVHKLSYRVSPFINEDTGSSAGYMLEYLMYCTYPVLYSEDLIVVGSDSGRTYPEAGEFATRFIIPTGLSQNADVYIIFYATVDTEELTVGTNKSTVTVVKESP